MTVLFEARRPPAVQPAPVVVDGHVIAAAEIAREAQYHPAGSAREAFTAAARALTLRRLLVAEADRQGVTGADEDDLVSTLLDRMVPEQPAGLAACRQAFDREPGRFRSPDLVEARHILLAAAPDDDAGRQAARDLALRLVAAVKADAAAFPALAAAHSACPSSATGGSLGQIGPGDTVPEFEAALAASPVGLIGEPVETRYGLHVVEVVRRIDGQPLPFDVVAPAIARALEARHRDVALRAYMSQLVQAARIEGVDLGDSARKG